MSIERFPVEAGHILQFARAVGDSDPVWEGAMRDEEAVPAPPTFVQASAQFDPEYGLRPRPGRPWSGSGRHATSAGGGGSGGSGAGGAGAGSGGGGGGTGLHAEQHYTYHRPLRSGMVLAAEVRPGATWDKQGRKGGRLVFAESITEYRDETGALVVTARGVGVRTEKVVEQGDGA